MVKRILIDRENAERYVNLIGRSLVDVFRDDAPDIIRVVKVCIDHTGKKTEEMKVWKKID